MRSGFFWAVTLSVGFHILLLSSLPRFSFKPPSISKTPQITFVKVQNIKAPHQILKPSSKIFKKYALDNPLSQKLPPPKYIPPLSRKKEPDALNKPLFKKPSLDKITFNQEKIMFIQPANIVNKSPAYMSYYETIREEIRKHAYNYYEVSSRGKVFVSFTLDNNGNLVNLYLDKSRSDSNSYLQDITVKSIKESLPFPKFPPSLKKFKTLTFSLTVYFKSN